MRLVFSAILLLSVIGVLIGLLGAQQNIYSAAAAFGSFSGNQASAEANSAFSIADAAQAEPVSQVQYVASITSVAQSLGENSLKAYQLNLQAAEDSSLLANEDWLEQAGQIGIHFSESGEMVRQMVVPINCLSVHEELLQAVEHYDRCAAVYEAAHHAALTRRLADIAAIERCTQELQAGYLNVKLAEELLTELQANQDDTNGEDSFNPSALPFSAMNGAARIVTVNANLRSGPGTSYDVVGGRQRGEIVTIIATDEGRDWVQLDGGEWMAAWLLDEAPDGLPTARP